MNKSTLTNLCTQVTNANTLGHDENNESYCPFCNGIGAYGVAIDDLPHDESCAYFIALNFLQAGETWDDHPDDVGGVPEITGIVKQVQRGTTFLVWDKTAIQEMPLK